MIFNLIETHMGKLILNHLIGNNCPEFRNGLMDSYFFKLTLGIDYLELCFGTVTFKTTLKYNSAHILSLNLTPKLNFESRFHMFSIYVYYKKSKRL